MKTIAYRHRLNARCVTSDPQAYVDPIELVDRADAESIAFDKAATVDALKGMVRMHLAHPLWPAQSHRALLSYEAWAMDKAIPERDAMRDALVIIAKADGKSCFGSDWQHAMED